MAHAAKNLDDAIDANDLTDCVNCVKQSINTMLLTMNETKASDVMAYLNVSRSTAGRILTKLSKKGYLKKVGNGSATAYRKSE